MFRLTSHSALMMHLVESGRTSGWFGATATGRIGRIVSVEAAAFGTGRLNTVRLALAGTEARVRKTAIKKRAPALRTMRLPVNSRVLRATIRSKLLTRYLRKLREGLLYQELY